VVSKWVPQFGYKKVANEQEKNWMMPMKSNAPDDEDPYEKLAESKREKVAKNELQRLRNLAKVKKVAVPTLGVLPSVGKKGDREVRSVSQSEDLRKAAEVAKVSTASLGKFQKDLNKKLESSAKTKGSKRKFESNTGDAETEKSKSLRVLDSITNKSSSMDIDAAVNKQIFKEDIERRTEKEKNRESKGKMKQGGKGKRSKSHFANKGGTGKYTGNSKPKNRGLGMSKAQKKKANPSKRK
jgi:regulator of ribosome biosynthesis